MTCRLLEWWAKSKEMCKPSRQACMHNHACVQCVQWSIPKPAKSIRENYKCGPGPSVCRLYLVNFLDMRGLRLAPGKFWDSDPLRDWIWESFQQKSLSNGYSTFLITGILGIRPLNVRVISRITPSEIKFESHLSSISQYLLSTEYSTYQITRKFENYASWDWMCMGTI